MVLATADWVVIARHESDIAVLDDDYRWRHLAPASGAGVWTDDFSNIVRSMRWVRRFEGLITHAVHEASGIGDDRRPSSGQIGMGSPRVFGRGDG